MTTITNKKQYPSEQYLNELITNIEFAARAPVEVVSAMAAELQKRREADSAEPVAYIFKHPAGKLFWALTDESNKEQADVIPVYAASPAPIASEAIENAIEYIRSIAFHIDEDDYHGKHIAYFMRQALAWLEGHSCSDDRLGKADNQPASGNQAAESNRGNEWTGNPDIDNAIIMLDRIDTAESCDDDRIEAVKAVLRRLAGNYPDIPDSSVPAPGKGVTGERIRIKPHVYRELVNRLHDTAIKCAGTQQLRERISRVLGDVITPDHHKQAEKSGLERCRLEAALNIKPGHTLGIIDALLVHKMARALLPLVAEKHEVDHANES
ncbi:hypothetical protein E0K87_17700 [Escherichia coli]|nr:hypothetical protein E0K87_17700 [Escherichia coli]TZA61563.1 hypothetical protein E0K88_17355 [Escherichia coli]